MFYLLNIFKDFGDAPLCNGHPERAPHIGDFVFPLCWRCTMIAVGLMLGLILINLLLHYQKIELKGYYLIIAAILIIPTFIDGLVQTFSDYVSTNPIRAITGFFAGIGISIVIMYVLSLFIKK